MSMLWSCLSTAAPRQSEYAPRLSGGGRSFRTLSEGLRNGPEQSLSHWQCGSLMKGPAAHSSSRLRPVWDYTLCTLVNDLHISERLTGSQSNLTPQRPREMPYRDLLGSKVFYGPRSRVSTQLPSVSKVRSARRGGVSSRRASTGFRWWCRWPAASG